MKIKHTAAISAIVLLLALLLTIGFTAGIDDDPVADAAGWFRTQPGVSVIRRSGDTLELQLQRGLRAARFIRRLQQFAGRHNLEIAGWESTSRPDQLQIRLSGGGNRFRILAVWEKGGSHLAAVQQNSEQIPLLALVLDDAGSAVLQDRFLELPARMTFAVMPDTAGSTAFARRAVAAGHQVIAHVPMLPLSADRYSLPERLLRPGMSRNELIVMMRSFLQQVPGAVGVNNHMGSAATADPVLMNTLMDYLEPRGLFFLDSLTSHLSVAFRCAFSNRVPAAVRDLFLDHRRDYSSILHQLDKAAALARQKGFAVAIGHVTHSNMLAALQKKIPELKKTGIKFIYVSELVK